MTTRAHAWARLPAELKYLRQWCVAGANKAPLSVGPDGKLFNASVTQPSQWMDFDTAAQVAFANGYDIGFVLHESDPYSCIDLDVKDAQNCPDKPELWTTPEQYDLFYRIMQGFDSYAEASRSGKGLHIWVRGNIGKGVRRDGVEIYSQERFIICTGNIVQDKPVRDCQPMLLNMASQMRPKEQPADFALEEVEQDEDDWSILVRAVSAGNSEKFCGLWRGQWEAMGFPSQSEADLALMSMFTFYSASNAQCRRLFRESALGKREKAMKDDRYINRTLSIIRSRMAREASVDASALVAAADTMLEAKRLAMQEVQRLQGGVPAIGAPQQRTATPLHIQGQGDPQQLPSPTSVAATLAGPVSAGVVQAGAKGLPWPPGFAGRIAQYIYQSAPRPVKEVAIVASLGLLAGICGKAWHVPQSGLNMYIILVARSAVGKEAMHSGISSLIRACTLKMPTFHNFIDFTDFASGPALIKACANNPSFVNVSGEWGRKLKRLANDDRDGPLSTLRTQMTNLYQKSGPQSIVGGIGYSNKDNNIASISGVAYSMIGETTPSTFYEALTESMMEDGFLSRFLIVEYDGERPPMNTCQTMLPDAALQDALVALAFQAQNLIGGQTSQPLGRTEEAAHVMWEFEQECDREINNTDDESRRQMWNRAALKVLRLSGLLAVADNWVNPCITREHLEWALDVVRRDIKIMGKRLDTGDVGTGDSARERKLVSVLRDYLASPLAASYKVPEEMRQNSIIPRSYLQIRTSRVASFYNHRAGQNAALDLAVQSAVNNGYLMEVDKAKVAEAYNYHGKAYRIIKLPDYAAQAKKS
ncbi:hypothetical protein [Pseudomonas phage pPA-3099-2aT.3]|nr:hypothetical protein [Pseudomonas phage pPA-3099-2aT.3]